MKGTKPGFVILACLFLVGMAAAPLAAEPSVSISVSPATTVAHTETVTLTATVSDPSRVASYLWKRVPDGKYDLSTAGSLTLYGHKWPDSADTRTFRVTVTLHDGSQVAAEQSIVFTDPLSPPPPPPPPDVSVSISVSPATTVAHTETVTLTATVSDPSRVASYLWKKVGGKYDLSTTGSLTLYGHKWPDSAGTRTFRVTVTLHDGSQITATQAIAFTQPSLPPNQSPVGTGPLPAQTLTAGEAAVSVDAASAFTDPDGDSLTYSAVSDAPAVATVSVVGAVVSLTGLTEGVATVTVTAQDPGGLTASEPLAVTVAGSGLIADLLVDTNRDGQVDASDEAGEEVWTQASGAVFGPNQDDDDEDGVRDSLDTEVNGEADLLDMAPVVVRRMSWLSENHSVVIEMTSGRPRLFLQRADGSFEVLINTGADFLYATLPVASLKAGDVRLYLESEVGRARGFDGNVTLVLKVEDGGGVVARDEVALRGSPVLLSHHLQPVERLFVMDLPVSSGNNVALVGALETGLPDYADLYKIHRHTYSYDRWAQDFMQTGYVQRPSPDGVTTDVVHMKLARVGSLASFLPNEYLGPDAGFVYPARYSSHSVSWGGNLEIIPPHTHNGRHYPFGRVVVGGGSKLHTMDRDQIDFINAQEAQGPVFDVRSDWLYVGHIDEIFLVVPNLEAGPDERPWAIVIASPALAIKALQAAQEAGHGSAKVFKGRTAYDGYETTVAKLLSNSSLMDYNDSVQGIIDTVREKLKSEIGLTDGDFHEVPVLYEDSFWGALALSPGIQNLVVGDTVLFVPDPEGPDVDGVDVWQQATRKALDGLGLDIEFVDVFYSYHIKIGEAHCGTNVERAGVTETPWWTLDGEEQP